MELFENEYLEHSYRWYPKMDWVYDYSKQIEEEKIINSPDILEKKIKNIEKEIQKYISKISKLEKEKDDLMKNL